MVVLLGCDEATQPESAGAAFMMPGSSMTAPNATGPMDAEAYPAQNVTDAAMTLDRDSGEDRSAQDRGPTGSSEEGACADQTSDAQAPSEEVCNGMDDDCDGVIDEDVEEIMCGEGMCQRTARCVDGQMGV